MTCHRGAGGEYQSVSKLGLLIDIWIAIALLAFLMHCIPNFKCSISERLGKVTHTRSRNIKRQLVPMLWGRIGTELSETIVTFSFSAAHTTPCSEQLVHSSTAGMILIVIIQHLCSALKSCKVYGAGLSSSQ